MSRSIHVEYLMGSEMITLDHVIKYYLERVSFFANRYYMT